MVNFASNGDAVLSCCDAAKILGFAYCFVETDKCPLRGLCFCIQCSGRTTCSGCAEIAGSSCISCAGGRLSSTPCLIAASLDGHACASGDWVFRARAGRISAKDFGRGPMDALPVATFQVSWILLATLAQTMWPASWKF